MVDRAFYDSARYDYTRYDVYIPIFDNALKQIISQGLSANVTRHKLALGSIDSTTGWYGINFNAEPVEMIIEPRGSTLFLSIGGTYPKFDLTGFTCDAVAVGDVIQTFEEKYFTVQTVESVWMCDSFVYRMCNLVENPFFDVVGAAEPTVTVTDSRKNTRDWLDAYLSLSVDWISMYTQPPYPITRIFKDKGIEVIYAVGEPVSRPLYDCDHSIYGYNSDIPIFISCITTQSYQGTTMKYAAEEALKTVAENHPLGSIRHLTRRRPVTERYGTITLYTVEYTLNYDCDTT